MKRTVGSHVESAKGPNVARVVTKGAVFVASWSSGASSVNRIPLLADRAAIYVEGFCNERIGRILKGKDGTSNGDVEIGRWNSHAFHNVVVARSIPDEAPWPWNGGNLLFNPDLVLIACDRIGRRKQCSV